MRTSWKDKALKLITTGALVMGMLPTAALAEGALVLDSTAAPDGPGYALTVKGLEAGDTADYYRVIEQDSATKAWKLSAAVDADADGKVDGSEFTIDDLVISSFETTDENGDETDPSVVTSDTRQLTVDMANALATAVTNNVANGLAATGSATADENGIIEVEDAVSGAYMFVAVPKQGNDYLYKPIFVSADFANAISTPEDNTHTIELVTGEGEDAVYADYRDDKGTFKKSPLSIDKQCGTVDENGNVVDLQQDVAVGDTLSFTITVPVPTYTDNYVAPQFYITDTLTEGLKLNEDSIEVKVTNGASDLGVTKDKDYKVFAKTDENPSDEFKAFKNVATGTFDGFVVQFLNDDPTSDAKGDGFLRTVLGAPTATITYTATVTETAKQKFAQQVTQMDNTAKLNYSNDPNFVPDGYFKDDPDNPGEKTPDPEYPTDTPDPKDPTGDLTDKTRHYTFDIDADVLGRDQSGDTEQGPGGEEIPVEEENHDRTSEIRKTWIDANGKVIQEKETGLVKKGGTEQDGVSGETEGNYGWLEGAEFTLTKTQAHVTKGEGTEEFQVLDEPEAIKFDATSHIRVTEGGSNPVSDGKGYIAMKGLDAGVYVLKETKAPLGYAFNPNIQYQITITPTYVMEPGVPPTLDDGKGGADDLILDSYTVEIVTQKLDDNLNVVGEETVTTISTYNMKQDGENGPASLLKDDGSSNVDGDGATGGIDITTEAFGNNKTAMVVNKKLGLLPATGGSGILFYLGIGGVVVAASAFVIYKTKKQEEQLA